MVVRSAYAQLGFSPWRLAFVVVAMLAVFVSPVVLAFAAGGWTRALAIGAWLLMAALYVPMLKRYRVPVAWALALPAIAACYLVVHDRVGLAARPRPRRDVEGPRQRPGRGAARMTRFVGRRIGTRVAAAGSSLLARRPR